MDSSLSNTLFEQFEAIKRVQDDVEFWSARDLQKLFGYKERRNFQNAIDKARQSCEGAGGEVSDHFVDINKSIKSGKGALFDVPDAMLSRYACYLIAQNGDPVKVEIAFAQSYFAVQTRG